MHWQGSISIRSKTITTKTGAEAFALLHRAIDVIFLEARIGLAGFGLACPGAQHANRV